LLSAFTRVGKAGAGTFSQLVATRRMEIKSFCARADGKGGSVVVETDDVQALPNGPGEFGAINNFEIIPGSAHTRRPFLGVGRRIPALLLQRCGGLGERREHDGTLMEVTGDDVVASVLLLSLVECVERFPFVVRRVVVHGTVLL
jgi:hypothetical protein